MGMNAPRAFSARNLPWTVYPLHCFLRSTLGSSNWSTEPREWSPLNWTPTILNLLLRALEMSQSRMASILRHETRGTIMVCADRPPDAMKLNLFQTDGHHPNFYEEILSRSDALRSACRISLMDVEEWIREWAMDSWMDVVRPVDRGKIDYRRVRLEISRSNLRKTRLAFCKEQLADLMLYFKQSAQSPEEPTSLRNDR